MKIITLCCFLLVFLNLSAQDEITNAFNDLERSGTFSETESPMDRYASDEQLSSLIKQKPAAGYFCFAEPREREVRSAVRLPEIWTSLSEEARTAFNGNAAPGEFYTWQLAFYTPYQSLQQLFIKFEDLKSASGERIPAERLRCFNFGGVDTRGVDFVREVSLEQHEIRAMWVGADLSGIPCGVYRGKLRVGAANAGQQDIAINITVEGSELSDAGDKQAWRKSRLRWLDSKIGNGETPTAPYTPLSYLDDRINYLGGTFRLQKNGLPGAIETRYDAFNRISDNVRNPILGEAVNFRIETAQGVEHLSGGKLRILHQSDGKIEWEQVQENGNFRLICNGSFGFDGMVRYMLRLSAKKQIRVKDVRLEVPYTRDAATYWMGLGNKGGFRSQEPFEWKWDTLKHQDKIWMGAVNGGLNFTFMDENYVRPLVNIYYDLGRLRLPESWGNEGKGGIRIADKEDGNVWMTAYSGEREMQKNQELSYGFNMLITPVKPIDLDMQANERFYHSNSDVSEKYIRAAQKADANSINVHHKKDIYPFINYPYHDACVADFTRFVREAHAHNQKVRVYYTTRELTIKIPELWALRSLGSEVIHDGPGKDTRTLIHPSGPHEWLNKNLGDHFIPAWFNAFAEGKYAGDMDLSVITTPDSRWNNYYLAGLDWMIREMGIDGIYIDDSALDHQTLQRARRILDADGRKRLIDIHSWNHMNSYAGFANSLHLYLELLPYVDRTWIGEGFGADNTPDFWLVEMSGIPFGLLSETLDAGNVWRGMAFAMLPRLPWSGNPVPLWTLWNRFGMEKASLNGFWNKNLPVSTGNPDVKATVYRNGDKLLVNIANWTDEEQTLNFTIEEQLLGFSPSRIRKPEIEGIQQEETNPVLTDHKLPARGGLILIVEP